MIRPFSFANPGYPLPGLATSKCMRWPSGLTSLVTPSPLLAAGGSFTLETWINLSFTTPSGYAGSDTAQYLFYCGGGLRVLLRNTSTDLSNFKANTTLTAPPLAQNVWQHLRFSFDASAGRARIDVNNVVKSSGAWTAFAADQTFVDIGFVSSSAVNNPLNGTLDETRFWPYLRTDSQNAASWQKPNSGLPDLSTAAGAWAYEDAAPTTSLRDFVDGSGNGRHQRGPNKPTEPSTVPFA